MPARTGRREQEPSSRVVGHAPNTIIVRYREVWWKGSSFLDVGINSERDWDLIPKHCAGGEDSLRC